MKKYPLLPEKIEEYILELKKKSYTQYVNLPEFWPQEDIREINTRDGIIIELKQILKDCEE